MKIILMAVGGMLCVFGLVDLIGSFAEFDLWGGFIGIQLPEILWQYSAYLELIVGYFIFKAGMAFSTTESNSDAQST